MVEVVRIKDPLDCVDKLAFLLGHHHFEFHLGISHHVAYLVLVHRPKLIVRLEEILRRVVLARCATQPMGIAITRQITKLRLLSHFQMRWALNSRNALGILGAWITLLK